MTALRATSVPARSSRGSGSVYPAALAVATASESGTPRASSFVMKPSVPESAHSIRPDAIARPHEALQRSDDW